MLAGNSASAQQEFFNFFGQQPVYQQERPQTHIIVRPSLRHRIGPGESSQGERDFCVRTCDGRFFPVVASGGLSSQDVCKSFCPASDVKVYSGSTIDSASSVDGKPYGKIANAFRYRNELVPGCTCRKAGTVGLAHIRIEDDRTIKVGDIVANANGLMEASREGRHGMIFTRIRAARLKAERLPAVASR